jgi:hypothetical protein
MPWKQTFLRDSVTANFITPTASWKNTGKSLLTTEYASLYARVEPRKHSTFSLHLLTLVHAPERYGHA